jgi:hypothetical protein
MRKSVFAFLLCSLSFFRMDAQEAKPLILLNDFSTQGISSEESRLIQALFASYLSEMGELINDNEGAATHPPDYSVNATIRPEQDGYIFMVEITNVRTGETHSESSVHKSTGELVLKARSILETAFVETVEPGKLARFIPEIISESRITGTWKGEAGIAMINLQRGGRGVAFFSSGAQMALSYTIAENTLKVRQESPNSERFYYPLPLYAARHLAEGAEPMVWELSLYQKGTVLSGIRQATAVRMEYGQVGELVYGGDIRQVNWTKAGH